MDNLPSSWEISFLGTVCSKPQYGWTCKAIKNGDLRILRTTDISKQKIDWSSVPFCEKIPEDIDKYRLKENDILVSRAGSVGVSCRLDSIPHEAVFASYLIRFKPKPDFNPKYIEYYLKSDGYWKSISEFSAGIAVPNVNASKLSNLQIPIAPANEQNRIVTKLEKLLAKVDKCKERLEKIPTILKRFRQSILAAACSGELTLDWRFCNSSIPPVSDLLEKISVERLNRLGKVTKSKFSLIESDPPKLEIPQTWKWCHISDLICDLTDYHANGSYKLLKENVHLLDQPDYAYMIRATNFTSDNFFTPMKYISKKAYEFLYKSKLFGGEIIIGKIGNAGEIYYICPQLIIRPL